MHTLTVNVINAHGECEHTETFTARSKQAVSMLAGKAMRRWWCQSEVDTLTITKRQPGFNFYVWDVR
jgi:glutamate/tyrosine decarboxylase-like PLP-dependent enzyme